MGLQRHAFVFKVTDSLRIVENALQEDTERLTSELRDCVHQIFRNFCDVALPEAFNCACDSTDFKLHEPQCGNETLLTTLQKNRVKHRQAAGIRLVTSHTRRMIMWQEMELPTSLFYFTAR
jgi:hypothetical protein